MVWILIFSGFVIRNRIECPGLQWLDAIHTQIRNLERTDMYKQ